MMIKKQLKKIFCMILSIAMIVGSSIPALAAEPDVPAYSVTISEYDVYVSTRTATKEQLARSNVNSQTVAVIKSDAIENELMRLSKLSTEELSQLGYNAGQITLLHNYSGERIETNPSLRGIFADMTCDFYKSSASTSSLAVKVVWEWTNGVNPKFCVKSNACRNRAKFICRRQRLDRLPPMSIT